MAHQHNHTAHSTITARRQWRARSLFANVSSCCALSMCLFASVLESRALADSVPASAPQAPGPWKVEKNADGIVVSSRTRPQSAYAEVRGETVYDAPPEALISLFRDANAYSLWLAECKHSSAVGTKQGLNDFYLHAIIGIPWPFEDRDTVVKAKVRKLPKANGYVVFLRSMNESLVPERKGLVRMKTLQGRWLLEATEDGKTRAEFRVFFEPSGALSPAFVNSMSTRIQHKTLRNVRERLSQLERPTADLGVPELGLLDPTLVE